jgi:hypothetical protein
MEPTAWALRPTLLFAAAYLLDGALHEVAHAIVLGHRAHARSRHHRPALSTRSRVHEKEKAGARPAFSVTQKP